MTKERKAIVTGGAGFIGSHLVDVLLDRGWKVLVVDDLSSGQMEYLAEARSRGAAVHVTDITSEELVELFDHHKSEVVYHLAAQSKVRPSVEDPIRDARVNVIGTLNVLGAAASSGVRKVCFASSGGAVYGDGAKTPTKESAAKRPGSPYGISKKIVEDYFRWYRDAYGLEYSLLALANVYGPRQDPGLEGGVVAIFAQAMLNKKRPTVFGSGRQTRDFVYVGDVCDAFIRAADGGDGLFLNIGSGTETSVLDLYDLIADLIGYKDRPEFGPEKPGDVLKSVVDPGRAKRALDWEAWTALEDGLAKTIDSYR
jgi:UDP-glucose 4-epimerase